MRDCHRSFYMFDDEEPKKTEHIVCRVERKLFLSLAEEAKGKGLTISDLIRNFCREGLEDCSSSGGEKCS